MGPIGFEGARGLQGLQGIKGDEGVKGEAVRTLNNFRSLKFKNVFSILLGNTRFQWSSWN